MGRGKASEVEFEGHGTTRGPQVVFHVAGLYLGSCFSPTALASRSLQNPSFCIEGVLLGVLAIHHSKKVHPHIEKRCMNLGSSISRPPPPVDEKDRGASRRERLSI